MSYRGRDLDLRTPERWQPHYGADEVMPPSGGGLVVDEAVLACCNHGYDLALAHRAREVRIEHLLNAMSRIDAAVSVLVGHGIDVVGLRHDTASLIALDEAIIAGAERLSPRRSQLFADVLHIAGERARARGTSVGIADVLRTLLELNSEQPGVVMLKRNAPGWQPRNAGDPLRADPLPPLSGAYQVETRYVPAEPRAGEWVRVPAPQAGYYQAPQPGYYVTEAPAAIVAPSAVVAPGSTVTDAVQNARLEQIERSIRELAGQFAPESRREPVMVPEPVIHNRGGLDERLAGIERNVDAKFADIARGWAVLGERLQALEQAVNSARGESTAPGALVDKLQGLDGIAENLAAMGDLLAGVERQLGQRNAGVNLEPIVERLSAIEHAQTLGPSATAAALAPVIERLTGIERAQANRPAGADLQPVLDRIAGLERSIASRMTGPVDLAPVLDRLQMIEARVGEINRGATGINDRIGQFERRLETGNGASERVAAQIAERVRSIEEAMIAQRNQVAQMATNLTAEVKALGQSVNAQGASGERIQALVSDRFQTLTAVVDQGRADMATAVAQPLGDRIAALEKVLQGFGQRTLNLHAAHGADLVELHNALVKLNGNQQTLAASMDQWRLDNGNELSQLLTRLDGVERANQKPMQLLESLQTNVQSLQRSTAKREEQRSRFKTWLMGTDDWYGASWENGAPGGPSTNPPARR